VCSGSRPGWGQTPANFVWEIAKSPQTCTNLANETGRHGGDLVVFDCFPPQHPRGPSLSPSGTPYYHLDVAADPTPLAYRHP